MSIQKLKEIIVLTASYYEKTIKPEILAMYVDDLKDLPLNEVIEAYGRYRRNPKNRTMPMPAQIRALIQPVMSERDLAEQVLVRVIDAIRGFGWCNPEKAKESIGPIGWSIVKRMGGWHTLCTDPDFNHGVFRAQFINAAESEIRFQNIQSMDQLLAAGNEKPLLTHDDFKGNVLQLVQKIGNGGGGPSE